MPDDEDVRFTFDHGLVLRTLGTGTVEVRASEVQVDREVRLRATVDVVGWERLYDAGCFHLDDEPAPVGFDADHPVAIELRLRSRVGAAFGDPESLLKSLLNDPMSPLRHTEAWYATEAIQRLAVPGEDGAWVEIGIRTSFADEVG